MRGTQREQIQVSGLTDSLWGKHSLGGTENIIARTT